MTSKNHHEHKNAKTNRLLYAKFQKSSDVPPIVSFLIKIHFAKNEETARRIVLTIILIALLVAVYLITNSFNSPIFIDKVIN